MTTAPAGAGRQRPIDGARRAGAFYGAPGRGGGGGSGARSGPARSNRRYLVSMALMTTCLGAILARLLFVQGIDAATYAKDARSEYIGTISFMGERGAILDRNGDELAMSVPMTTVFADPHQVTNPRAEAVCLARALGMPVTTLQSELTEESGFVYLAHTIPDATATKVTSLVKSGALPGIYTMQEPKRFYPTGQLASPLLGMVGTDGEGLAGLEYKYNSLLEGKPGKLIEDVDPAGYQIPGGAQEYQAPVRGDDIVLSIDGPLQYDAEQALARAIVAAQAQSGMALIMSSRTGDLLAVAELTMPTASEPVTMHEPPALPVWFVPPTDSSSDPASTSTSSVASSQPVESPTASAFTTVYEPGSVEKLVTISAALANWSITPTEYFTVPDTYDVAGTPINDAWDHPTLDWTASNILAHSSDIGTVEIAQRLGMPNLLSYINAFGIGERTDIDYPGESAGLIPGPSQWSGTTIATVPIGQGLAVTAIQMLDAYNTIANGGVYIPPRLVDGYIDAQGGEHLFPAARPHRAVSPLVAKEVTSMLEGVVTVGTGMAANLEPYTVAGKTGTALKPSPDGGYIANDFVSSFVGFVPAEDPAITAMVVVDGTHQYGAEASAPVFAMLARDALHELGIPPHKPEPPVPGVPQATPYGGEGEAAGPVLPGLAGTPDVQVSPSAGATTSTTVGSVPAATTTVPAVPAATTTVPAATTTVPAATTTVPAATTTVPAATTTVPAATTTVPAATTTAPGATTPVVATNPTSPKPGN